MDLYRVPLGFGMALSRNFTAMNAYSALTEEQKSRVLSKVFSAQSEQEMNRIADDIAGMKQR